MLKKNVLRKHSIREYTLYKQIYLLHASVIGLDADAFQDLLDVTCAGSLFASEGSEQVSGYVTHPETK